MILKIKSKRKSEQTKTIKNRCTTKIVLTMNNIDFSNDIVIMVLIINLVKILNISLRSIRFG